MRYPFFKSDLHLTFLQIRATELQKRLKEKTAKAYSGFFGGAEEEKKE